MDQSKQHAASSQAPSPAEWREVVMERGDLEKLPRFDAPTGFGLRSYSAGDEAAWTSIHRRADAFNHFSPSTFRSEFGHDEAALSARQKYLLGPGGEPIGTATAWFDAPDDSSQLLGAGRVHWVAIVPEFQGRGLSRPLLAEVLQTLRELGHARAVLSTDTRRPAAIALYQAFGFRVVPR